MLKTRVEELYYAN